MVDTTLKTIAPSIAVKIPSSISPGTTKVVKYNTTAFITKVNSPKVKRFIGSVIIVNIGLTTVLITPITMAARRAVVKESTLNPGTRYAVANNASAFKKMVINIFKSSPPLF